MVNFGICARLTDTGFLPQKLAQIVETEGFESLWFGEHTHWPDPSNKSPQRDVSGFDQLFDPYVCLAASAVATRNIKLGTSVSLVPQHHPIVLAKQMASLDHISDGRIIFGIGAGSGKDEVEDFGFNFKDRWKVTREFIHAIKTIWKEDVPEYHGEFLDFGAMRSWPKPLDKNRPPILIGAFSKWVVDRVEEYADGWVAWDAVEPRELGEINRALKKRMPNRDLDFSVVVDYSSSDVDYGYFRAKDLIAQGFNRIIFLMNHGDKQQQMGNIADFCRIRDELSRTAEVTH